MRNCIALEASLLGLVALVAVLISPRPATAQELIGRRTLVDAAALPQDMWEKADGTTVSSEGGQLTIAITGGQRIGWAATRERVQYDPTAIVNLQSRSRTKVQAEFFDDNGQYITSTVLRDGQRLAQNVPTDISPRSFRLKFWVEGPGAKVQFRKALVFSLLRWKEPGVRVIRKFGPDAHVDPDAGMKVQARYDAIVGKLDGSKPYSAFHLSEKIERVPNMVLLIDVPALVGGMSVQALTWAEDGSQLKAVDLLKDLTAAGTYEVSLKDFEDQFPDGTHKISLKIWLNGKNAECRVAGVYWGVITEPK